MSESYDVSAAVFRDGCEYGRGGAGLWDVPDADAGRHVSSVLRRGAGVPHGIFCGDSAGASVMIGLQGTSSAQSARQPAGASSAQSACQPVGTASAQSVIPTAYAMPQSVVLPIADTALLTARTLARYHFPED